MNSYWNRSCHLTNNHRSHFQFESRNCQCLMSSLSTTTASTSIVTESCSKVSWIVMPSNCWPDPGSSIGSWCQSLDPLGRYKCWNLREKSPAFLIWREVLKAIASHLDDQFEHLDTRGSDLIVEMFMVGKKPPTHLQQFFSVARASTLGRRLWI